MKRENKTLDKEIHALNEKAHYKANAVSFEGGTSTKLSISYGDQPVAPSLLNPPPDREKVEKIVDALDIDGDGNLSVAEVKVLFGKMLQVNPVEIPDDHSEVLAFAGLSREELIEKLVTTTSKDQLDKYFDAMFDNV